LSANINAIHLLEKNIDKIDWDYLSGNFNAIHILEKNMDKINWNYLSSNPNAINILKKNISNIYWSALSFNKNALYIFFDYDYEQMKKKNSNFCKELVTYVYHPNRIKRLSKKFNIDETIYLDILE
jgi:predicted Ser/Thr protein kinase